MASVNKAILVGNLGADVEMRYLPSGDAIANFRIATTDRVKDKESGEFKEYTEWHRCTAFGRLADICGQYLKKGTSVYLEGAIRTRKWQAQDGTDRYSTEIRIDVMQILAGGNREGGNREGGEQRERSSGTQQRQPREREGTKAGSAPGARHQGGGPSGGFDEMDDDIPFRQPYTGMQLLSCI